METYYGNVRAPADAIVLFEACRIGLLPRVQRRLSGKERQSIRSGSVFVWDEREAGMRRWTDGKTWSASRVSGSFLTYREMEGKRGGDCVSQSSLPRAGNTTESRRRDEDRGESTDEGGDEGPDGYRYKRDGLLKQSFSITTCTGQHLHLISYYSHSHPIAANLQHPTTDPALRHVRPQKGLYPESTANDQQNLTNLTVVTRGPMPGARYPNTPHPIGSDARTTYEVQYAWPSPPLAAPSTVNMPYGTTLLPRVLPFNGSPPYSPQQHQSSLHTPRQGLLDPDEQIPYLESAIPGSQPPAAQVVYPARPPRVMYEPSHDQGTPCAYEQPIAGARLAPPRTPTTAIPRANGAAPRSHLLKQTPQALAGTLQQIGSMGTPPKQTELAEAVPGIGLLMNGTSLAPIMSSAAPSNGQGSPNGAQPAAGAEGVRDIPKDNMGFAEDVRALRQLDRVFSA